MEEVIRFLESWKTVHALLEAPHQVRDTFFVGAATREIQHVAAAFHEQEGLRPYERYFVTSATSNAYDPVIAREFWELPHREFFHALKNMLRGGKQIKVRKALPKEDWIRVEVKYFRQILQSDPWKEKMVSGFESGFEKFVKDYGVDHSDPETPCNGLPIEDPKEYCVMLLKQLNKTPSDISVEKNMLKRMLIKLFTEEETKWALTFFEFERILRCGLGITHRWL